MSGAVAPGSTGFPPRPQSGLCYLARGGKGCYPPECGFIRSLGQSRSVRGDAPQHRPFVGKRKLFDASFERRTSACRVVGPVKEEGESGKGAGAAGLRDQKSTPWVASKCFVRLC